MFGKTSSMLVPWNCKSKIFGGNNTAWKVSVYGVFLVRISCIWSEYGDVLCKSPYSVRMWENKDQESSSYGHFLWSLNLEMYRIIVSHKFLRYYHYFIPPIVLTSQKDWNITYRLMGYCRNSSLHAIYELKPEFRQNRIHRILQSFVKFFLLDCDGVI